MRTPRRGSAFDQAEAAFKSVTTKPVESAVPARKAAPEGKEMITLRLDRTVIEHFQEDGPGWQDRINAALRVVAGLD